MSARERAVEPILDRKAIEAVLPHRAPFLFLDRVTALDSGRGLIAARYDLTQAGGVMSGHFPNHPVWPGVRQVEAIAQAGCLLHLTQSEASRPSSVALTHIVAARFMRPIGPRGEVEVLARLVEEGLFAAVIGQCVYDGALCSVAAVQAVA